MATVKSNSVIVVVQSSTPSCSVSSLTLSLNPTTVSPGGSVSFTAGATDSNGNPVSGAGITLVDVTTNTQYGPELTNSLGTVDFSVTFPTSMQPGSYYFYAEACEMAVKSNSVVVTVQSSSGGSGGSGGGGSGSSGSCTTGMYITINGTAYPYSYSANIPSGYHLTTNPSNFCVYYQGGKIATGCYCYPEASGSPLSATPNLFYTDGNGGWWAMLTLENNSTGNLYQFSIAWNEGQSSGSGSGGSSGGGSGSSGSCKTGPYITINGTAYPYSYSPYLTPPSGFYPALIGPSNFCIYYEGGEIATGCYCYPEASGSPLVATPGPFYVSETREWWVRLTLTDSSTGHLYRFSIVWSEL